MSCVYDSIRYSDLCDPYWSTLCPSADITKLAVSVLFEPFNSVALAAVSKDTVQLYVTQRTHVQSFSLPVLVVLCDS